MNATKPPNLMIGNIEDRGNNFEVDDETKYGLTRTRLLYYATFNMNETGVFRFAEIRVKRFTKPKAFGLCLRRCQSQR